MRALRELPPGERGWGRDDDFTRLSLDPICGHANAFAPAVPHKPSQQSAGAARPAGSTTDGRDLIFLLGLSGQLRRVF